jgi:toxin ParE1/3/4
VRVVFLESTEQDLKDLRQYILKPFGLHTWHDSYQAIKESIRTIQAVPKHGAVPDELAEVNLTQYRPVIPGMNRIVYELRNEVINIHIVCDTRRNTQSLLTRRLLRGSVE